jgi:F0F1-type ATP synthase delta subunit
MVMKNEIEKLADLIVKISKEREDKEQIAKTIVELLREKRKLHLLPKLLEEVKKRLKREETVLVLARKFDEKEIKEIKERIEKILSKKVEVKIDKEIIGGFLIKDQNYLINASIKGFLLKSERILWKFMKS